MSYFGCEQLPKNSDHLMYVCVRVNEYYASLNYKCNGQKTHNILNEKKRLTHIHTTYTEYGHCDVIVISNINVLKIMGFLPFLAQS